VVITIAKLKKVPGKSVKQEPVPVCRPTLYLDGKQVPADLTGVKPGKRVTLEVVARVVRKAEEAGGVSSVHLELQKIGVRQKK
jgi:hypothetical protein